MKLSGGQEAQVVAEMRGEGVERKARARLSEKVTMFSVDWRPHLITQNQLRGNNSSRICSDAYSSTDILVRCHLLVVSGLSYWNKSHIHLSLFTSGWFVSPVAKISPSILIVFQSFKVYSVSITLTISILTHQNLDMCKAFWSVGILKSHNFLLLPALQDTYSLFHSLSCQWESCIFTQYMACSH